MKTETEIKQSPGRWKMGWHSGHVFSDDGKHIATVNFRRVGFGIDSDKPIPTQEQLAYARLIVSAPVLLAACHAAANRFKSIIANYQATPSDKDMLQTIRAAIAEAEVR